ncbi:hypothetical protein B6U80_01740 [Candidatus Pacearchaeota archaeon ex4484_26]|nr:MAG: hypothetical protein B6U80_01740 [Candidatus Pacearchaeota archaeon ex4484_26]
MPPKQIFKKLVHAPTLNTVLMVEKVLKNSKQLITIAELKRALPRKVMHSTLLRILNYLQLSGKILISTKGIVWIFTPRKELDNLIKKGLEV